MQFWQTFSVVAALCVEKRPALHDTHVLEPFAPHIDHERKAYKCLWAAAESYSNIDLHHILHM